MSEIKARNKVNGLERTFTEHNWNMLGKKNTNWEQIVERAVVSEPETGDKKEVKEEVVVETPVVFEDVKKKEEFYKACVNINKGALKDYLDKNEVKYDQSSTVKDLVELLGVHCSYDKQIVKDNFQ